MRWFLLAMAWFSAVGNGSTGAALFIVLAASAFFSREAWSE